MVLKFLEIYMRKDKTNLKHGNAKNYAQNLQSDM